MGAESLVDPNLVETKFATVRLNDRAQPMHRGDLYEDPLDAELQARNLGRVTGGGTQLAENGEIAFCEIEVELHAPFDRAAALVAESVEAMGAPKGSLLIIDAHEQRPIGQLEGLALYLNGSDLPDATYQDCDINFVISELSRLLGEEGGMHSYWEGNLETALYFYGPSYARMRELSAEFIARYPLCQQARVVQIA